MRLLNKYWQQTLKFKLLTLCKFEFYMNKIHKKTVFLVQGFSFHQINFFNSDNFFSHNDIGMYNDVYFCI